MFGIDGSNRQMLRDRVYASGVHDMLAEKLGSIIADLEPGTVLPTDFVDLCEIVDQRLEVWTEQYQRRHPQRSLESAYAKVEDRFDPVAWMVHIWLHQIHQELEDRGD